MEHVDVVVAGAGQAGLATAYTLVRQGLKPVVLEASDQPAGSWPRYHDSLTLFSPARFSAFVGLGAGAPSRRTRCAESGEPSGGSVAARLSASTAEASLAD
ncbi:FAD-dependent oxidoreductase [Streptomyces amritsarensis]|uniref:FAD-dependent oxidoreductase n=1 Tax=Streptomyces amritsarensis TaxID=681158 RepID=UPI003680B7C0